MNKDDKLKSRHCIIVYYFKYKIVFCFLKIYYLMVVYIFFFKESYVNIVPPHHHKLRPIHATGYINKKY